jgi:hypothetical protein
MRMILAPVLALAVALAGCSGVAPASVPDGGAPAQGSPEPPAASSPAPAASSPAPAASSPAPPPTLTAGPGATAVATARATPTPPSATPTQARASASPSTPAPTPTPAALHCLRNVARNAFVAGLLDEIGRRDRSALVVRMPPRFRYVVEATDVTLAPVRAATAARQLYDGVPDPDGEPWFLPVAPRGTISCVRAVTAADLHADRGFWPTQWDVAVLTDGWGEEGDAEGLLMLGTAADGRLVWRGLVFSHAGFGL